MKSKTTYIYILKDYVLSYYTNLQAMSNHHVTVSYHYNPINIQDTNSNNIAISNNPSNFNAVLEIEILF